MILRTFAAASLTLISLSAFAAGPHPSATDSVTVNYVGKLANGTVFDSSARHGGPATFRLDRVIPCWTQGLQSMTVGETKQLICPPDTAYGANGIPGVIPPNSTLHFTVTLLHIGH